MREVFLVGVSMTKFGIHPDKSAADLGREAVTAALAETGLKAGDPEAVFYANTAQGAIEGQHGMKGQHALMPIGVQGMPFYNVENACTGSSSALNLAVMQVAGGFADIAMAVGAEKLHTVLPRSASPWTWPRSPASWRNTAISSPISSRPRKW